MRKLWMNLGRVLISILAVAFFTDRADANTITFACGTPTIPADQNGMMSFEFRYAFPGGLGDVQSFADPLTEIPGSFTAAEKCVDLEISINTLHSLGRLAVTAQASGTSLIITGPPGSTMTGVIVTKDGTAENSEIGMTLLPGASAQLVEIPNPNQDVIPAAGMFFSGGLFASSFAPFTFFAVGDGIQTVGALLGDMNSQITAQTGISFFPATFNVNATETAQGFESSPFDPASVSIFWDANTSLDLANFGLISEAPTTATPEPATVLLIGVSLIALSAYRHRKALAKS